MGTTSSGQRVPPERLWRDPVDGFQASSPITGLAFAPSVAAQRSDRLAEFGVVSHWASTGLHSKVVRTARPSRRRDSARSLRRTDPVDSRSIRIGSIGRCVASDSRRSCGSMVRSNDGPDMDRGHDRPMTRMGRSRVRPGHPPARSGLGLRRNQCPAWRRSSRPSPTRSRAAANWDWRGG
jgi:hypothetical protein